MTQEQLVAQFKASHASVRNAKSFQAKVNAILRVKSLSGEDRMTLLGNTALPASQISRTQTSAEPASRTYLQHQTAWEVWGRSNSSPTLFIFKNIQLCYLITDICLNCVQSYRQTLHFCLFGVKDYTRIRGCLIGCLHKVAL